MERGLRVDEHRQPRFTHTRFGFHMLLPNEAYRLSCLVLQFLDATVDEFDHPSGGEHLLWLHDWSMWGDLMTSIGVDLFDRLRLGYGLDATMDQEPAMIFTGSEIGALISFALIPLVFGWDFYIIPASVEHLMFGCHDSWIGFSGKDEDVEAALVSRLKRWQPERSMDHRLAGSGALASGNA